MCEHNHRDSKLFRTSSQIYPCGFPRIYFWAFLRDNISAGKPNSPELVLPLWGLSQVLDGLKIGKSLFCLFFGCCFFWGIVKDLPRVQFSKCWERTGRITTHLYFCECYFHTALWKQHFFPPRFKVSVSIISASLSVPPAVLLEEDLFLSSLQERFFPHAFLSAELEGCRCRKCVWVLWNSGIGKNLLRSDLLVWPMCNMLSATAISDYCCCR